MYTFEQICEIAAPIAEKHGIASLGLFGSYARGEATESSDLDFIFDEGDKEMGLFEYFGIVLDLEEAFGLHVDLTSAGGRDREFLQRIAKDVRPIYERSRLSSRLESVGALREN